MSASSDTESDTSKYNQSCSTDCKKSAVIFFYPLIKVAKYVNYWYAVFPIWSKKYLFEKVLLTGKKY